MGNEKGRKKRRIGGGRGEEDGEGEGEGEKDQRQEWNGKKCRQIAELSTFQKLTNTRVQLWKCLKNPPRRG